MRLDKACTLAFPGISRSRIKVLIENECVTVDGCIIADPSIKVKSGQLLALSLPPPEPPEPQGENIPLSIAYEDEHLLVVDKPAGLVVHPAPGNASGTLVNALIAHCGDSLSGIGGVKRPGIVHRIDKDTSGLMVVAKTDAAHAGLARQFAEHSLDRAYLAVVWGRVSPESGVIEGAIGRSPANRKKMAIVSSGGKPALTRYRVIRHFGDIATLVECRLATGRTHQIRVHFSAKGHPLVGDATYGRMSYHRGGKIPEGLDCDIITFPRQALHAARIGFNHPILNEFLTFESPLPGDMEHLVTALSRNSKGNT